MIWFNQRKELEEKYYEWIRENNGKDCAFNVITFLLIKKLLNEEKVKMFLESDLDGIMD